jgi:hypothetical protein
MTINKPQVEEKPTTNSYIYIFKMFAKKVGGASSRDFTNFGHG